MGSAPCEVSLSLRSGELSASARNLPSRTCWIAVGMFANMLGVRREGVTEAAGKLQVDGVIQYSRGHIKVLACGKIGSARLPTMGPCPAEKTKPELENRH